MSKCIGCGVTLQNDNQSLVGYTPKLTNSYCERCFKTIHYGKALEVDNLSNDIIVAKINALNYYTFFITDIINLNNNVINLYNKITCNKVLVINKIDLLPKNSNLNHILDNIKSSYNINDVILISGKDKIGLNEIIKRIEKEECVLFCGETSSGKSTLINTLLDTKLTTSKFNNTTLDFIKLDYLRYTIYDTPGIILSKKSIYDKIKVSTKTLKSDYELIIDDYIITTDNILNMTLFLKDNVIVKTKKKIKNYEYEYFLENNSDVCLEDIGFIYIKKGSTIKSNKKLEIRKSIIGGK